MEEIILGEDLIKLRDSFGEAIDNRLTYEELSERWRLYRKEYQKVLKSEYKKINKHGLSISELKALKRFKNCFFSSNVEFRHMQRMLQTDTEVRETVRKYPNLNEYIILFEEGYSISFN